MRDAPALPGGVGISHLRVYDTTTPDGLVGGSAHVHLACTEGYVVLAGEGAVLTLGVDGYRETALQPGRVVWFEPGIVHRLVNHGGLEILTLMQNAGLPEAGDAVLTLPPGVLDDPARYAEATGLPEQGAPGTDVAFALRRRDLAVRGFVALRESVERDGPAALDAFYAAAVRLVQPRVADWRQRVAANAGRVLADTEAQLDDLAAGRGEHLRTAAIGVLSGTTEQGRLGMCGLLDTYLTGYR